MSFPNSTGIVFLKCSSVPRQASESNKGPVKKSNKHTDLLLLDSHRYITVLIPHNVSGSKPSKLKSRWVIKVSTEAQSALPGTRIVPHAQGPGTDAAFQAQGPGTED